MSDQLAPNTLAILDRLTDPLLHALAETRQSLDELLHLLAKLTAARIKDDDRRWEVEYLASELADVFDMLARRGGEAVVSAFSATLDWRKHRVSNRPATCGRCGRPALMRDELDRPCHKVCAEQVIADAAERFGVRRDSIE